MLGTYYGKYMELERQIARRELAVVCYQPTIEQSVDIDGRIVWQPAPLFFDYIFVRAGMESAVMDDMASILRLADMIEPLPIYPVRFGDRFAIVTDNEVGRIRNFTSDITDTAKRHANAQDFVSAYLGRLVMITCGAFGGTFGKVISGSGGNSVFVEIPLFEQATRCKVKVTDVQLV